MHAAVLTLAVSCWQLCGVSKPVGPAPMWAFMILHRGRCVSSRNFTVSQSASREREGRRGKRTVKEDVKPFIPFYVVT